MEVFEGVEVTIEELRFVIPIDNLPSRRESSEILQFAGPDGIIRRDSGRLNYERDLGASVPVVESSNLELAIGPWRCEEPLVVARLPVRIQDITKDVSGMVKNDIKNYSNTNVVGCPHQI